MSVPPFTGAVARDACRSWLFVPADNDRALAKAQQRGADVLILDLEDAVAPAGKAAARGGLAERIAMLRHAGNARIVVRVNHDAALLADDLHTAAGAGCDAVMLPKVETPAACADVVAALAANDRSPLGIIALLESPRGILAAAAIAAVPGSVGLALGSEDLAAGMATPPSPALLTLPCQTLALAAAAVGIAAVGLPVSLADYADLDGLMAAGRESRAMGLTGALCIHPSQVASINEAFAPTAQDQAWAFAVLEAWRDAEGQGSAVASLDNTMLDRPVIERARLIALRSSRN